MDTPVIIAIVILHIAAALLLYSIYLFIKHAQKKHEEQAAFKELMQEPLPKPNKPGKQTHSEKNDTKQQTPNAKEDDEDIPDLSHTIIDSALDGKLPPKQKSLPLKDRMPPPRAVHVSKDHTQAREAMQKAKAVLKHWEDEEHLVNYDQELDHIENELTKYYSKEKQAFKQKQKLIDDEKTTIVLAEKQRQDIYNKSPQEHLKTIHQEIYEEELKWIMKTLHTQTQVFKKAHKEQEYERRMQEIEDKIEALTGKRKFTKKTKEAPVAIPTHIAKFKEETTSDLADFKDFHDQMMQQTQVNPKDPNKSPKTSFFSRIRHSLHSKENTISQEQVEQKAVDLVKSISQKIEGSNPLPPQELTTISKELFQIHRDLWQK